MTGTIWILRSIFTPMAVVVVVGLVLNCYRLVAAAVNTFGRMMNV